MGRQGILESTLKKSPIAPNVSLAFMAELTDGFSGADLAELCQRAAKAAIRDAIAADELATDGMEVDEASEIGRKHFEEAMAGARRSVAQTDLAKYDQFRQKMQPTYNQGGGGMTINSPVLQLEALLMMMTTCTREVLGQLNRSMQIFEGNFRGFGILRRLAHMCLTSLHCGPTRSAMIEKGVCNSSRSIVFFVSTHSLAFYLSLGCA